MERTIVNKSGPFEFETNQQNLGMYAVGATTHLNAWPRLCKTKSNLVFCEQFRNNFDTLDLFKVDCKAEELTQGQHLVTSMMNTSLEEDPDIKCTESIL